MARAFCEAGHQNHISRPKIIQYTTVRDACMGTSPLASPPQIHPCVCMCVTEGQSGCTQVCRCTDSSVSYPIKPDGHDRGKDWHGVPGSARHTSQSGQYLHVHCTSPQLPFPLSPHQTHITASTAPNKPSPQRQNPCQPGRLLRLFLEPKSLTLENTFNLFLSQLPLLLLGLLTHLQALDFSRSLACLFWRIRELAMAAAMAATAPAAGAGQVLRGRWPAVASMLLGPSPRLGTLPLGDTARQPAQHHPWPLGAAAQGTRWDGHHSPGSAPNSLAQDLVL